MPLFRRICSWFYRRAVEITDARLAVFAGNAAFFVVLSLFPAFMLLLSILRIANLNEEAVYNALGSILPEVLLEIFNTLMKHISIGSTPAAIIISAVTCVWSASSGMLGILTGLNAIYRVTDRRNYFFKRLLSILYMILLMIAIVLTLLLHTFSQPLVFFLAGRLPGIYTFFIQVLNIRFYVMAVILCIFFLMIYLFLPKKKTGLLGSLPGALLSTVGWISFSELFSIYVNHTHLSVLYGSVTTIILLMLWLYACMIILMFGGYVNQFLLDRAPRIMQKLHRKPKASDGETLPAEEQ